MKKFKVGKRYYARSVCDSDTIFIIKVIKRTAKSIVYEEQDGTKRRAFFKEDPKGEYFVKGNYSMAPMFRAEKELEDPKKELPKNVIDFKEAKEAREKRREQEKEIAEAITKEQALNILGDRARELAANPEIMQEAKKMHDQGKTLEEVQTWIYHLAIGTLIGVR